MRIRNIAALLLVVTLAGCSADAERSGADAGAPAPQPTPRAAAAGDVYEAVLVGAGDIAVCRTQGDEATARLLDGVRGTVFALGDNVYPSGTLKRFNDCYDPSWGRHRERTRPAPGNHEYLAEGAYGYYTYFADLAGPDQRGYYAYNRNGWRIYSLNSQLVTQEQLDWLSADLAANPRGCSLAYWHHPRFSSGHHGNTPSVAPFWDLLYAAGAEIVIAGHDHDYERFRPQTPAGERNWKGIRQFVVGTGGAPLSDFVSVQPNSVARQATSRGVLKLRLRDGEYTWRFISVDGSFIDSGSARCHGRP